jgi:ABC-type phosphate transport system permease subunit
LSKRRKKNQSKKAKVKSKKAESNNHFLVEVMILPIILAISRDSDSKSLMPFLTGSLKFSVAEINLSQKFDSRASFKETEFL